MGTAAHQIRSTRRGVIHCVIKLTGLGVGVAPTVDHAGYLESYTRTAPGKLSLVFKQSHRQLLDAHAGYQSDDYATTDMRKSVAFVDGGMRSERTLVVHLQDRDHGRQVDEWTNPIAPAAAGLKAATATVTSTVTLTASDLLSGGKAELLARPRNVTFTTAGVTPAHAPATATITGTDINGDALTETVTLAQTATIAEGVKCFRTITSIAYPAGDGTAATVAIGFGKKFGLSKKIRARAGALMFGKEIAAGSVVTNGTLASPTTSPPNGSYSPNTDPDGSNDYSLEYEPDGNCKDLLDGEVVTLHLELSQAVEEL